MLLHLFIPLGDRRRRDADRIRQRRKEGEERGGRREGAILCASARYSSFARAPSPLSSDTSGRDGPRIVLEIAAFSRYSPRRPSAGSSSSSVCLSPVAPATAHPYLSDDLADCRRGFQGRTEISSAGQSLSVTNYVSCPPPIQHSTGSTGDRLFRAVARPFPPFLRLFLLPPPPLAPLGFLSTARKNYSLRRESIRVSTAETNRP